MPDYTILLIDYEPRSLERSRRPLAAAGYRVEIARDGLAGMEAFERVKPDLVLVEAMIPKKHGFEVCQDLKKTPQGKRTPVLITTAVYKGRKYRSQALHLYGCDEYLEKPLPDEQLVTICARFLGDEEVSARLARLQGVPEPVPVAAAAPAPTAAARAASEAEQEILDRLDAILPGSSDGADEPEIEVILDEPNAAHRDAPHAEIAEPEAERDEEPVKPVISLDEARARKRHKKGRHGSGRAGRGSGGAAASPEPATSIEPMGMVSEQPLLETAPSPMAETRLLPDPIPLPDAGSQSGLPNWVWAVAVAGLLGVFGLLWLMLAS